MKKITLTLVAMLTTIAIFAADIAAGQKLYLKPGTNWSQANARFAVNLFVKDQYALWLDMTAVDGKDGVFEVTLPAEETRTFDNIIFCRMNPDTKENVWENKWNQTADLTFDGTKTLFVQPNDGWDGADNANWNYAIDVNVASKVFAGEDVPFSASLLGSSETVTVAAKLSYLGDADFDNVTGNSFKPVAIGDYVLKITPSVGETVLPDIEVTIHAVYPIASGQHLFLSAQQWAGDNVRMAAYFYDNAGNNQWVGMEALADANMYRVVAPVGKWTNVIFCQMKGDAQENNWDNKTAQTVDLEYDGTNNLFTLADLAEG